MAFCWQRFCWRRLLDRRFRGSTKATGWPWKTPQEPPPAPPPARHQTRSNRRGTLPAGYLAGRQHRRPEIGRSLLILAQPRQCLPQELLHAFLVCIHGRIPCSYRSFLSNRSARNTRSFTAAMEMPNASITSLCGRPSTTASKAAMRGLGGSLSNADEVFWRTSAVKTGSAFASATGSVVSSADNAFSARLLRS
jgi:hypothetical protein